MLVSKASLKNIFDLGFLIKEVVPCPGFEKQLLLLKPKKAAPFYVFFDDYLDQWIKITSQKSKIEILSNIHKIVKRYKIVKNGRNSFPTRSFLSDPVWTTMFNLWNSEWGKMSKDGEFGILDIKLDPRCD